MSEFVIITKVSCQDFASEVYLRKSLSNELLQFLDDNPQATKIPYQLKPTEECIQDMDCGKFRLPEGEYTHYVIMAECDYRDEMINYY